MSNESACAHLIERYLSTCGLRFLRGDHEGEYFCVVNARPHRLHVHLEISSSFDDMVTITVTPARSFPLADRLWLTRLADTWNQQNRGLTAIVQGPCGSKRMGVSARKSQWIPEGSSFEDFASLVDRTIAAAMGLFAELAPAVDSPSTPQPLLRNAG